MSSASLFSAVSNLFSGSGPSVVACFTLAAIVVMYVVNKASYLRFKANGFEGEFRPRTPAKKPKAKG